MSSSFSLCIFICLTVEATNLDPNSPCSTVQHNDIGPQWHPTDVGAIKVASHLTQFVKLTFGWEMVATGPEYVALIPFPLRSSFKLSGYSDR